MKDLYFTETRVARHTKYFADQILRKSYVEACDDGSLQNSKNYFISKYKNFEDIKKVIATLKKLYQYDIRQK